METCLYYLQSRYYSSNIKRFISPDSYKYLDVVNINGLNLYCYCNNNPVMYEDRDGTKSSSAFFEFFKKIAIVSGISYLLTAFDPVAFKSTLKAIGVFVVLVNHVDNMIKLNRANNEVSNMSSYELDVYLSDVYIENVVINGKIVRNFKTNKSILNDGKLIDDYSINLSKYDRIKLLSAIQLKYDAKSPIYAMSAEWQGHNLLYEFTENCADIDIDDFDYRWYIRVPTYILMILGEI